MSTLFIAQAIGLSPDEAGAELPEEPPYKCTCPCIDCIEGRHCGGDYLVNNEGEADGEVVTIIIGTCHYPPPDEELDERFYPEEWDEEDDE